MGKGCSRRKAQGVLIFIILASIISFVKTTVLPPNTLLLDSDSTYIDITYYPPDASTAVDTVVEIRNNVTGILLNGNPIRIPLKEKTRFDDVESFTTYRVTAAGINATGAFDEILEDFITTNGNSELRRNNSEYNETSISLHWPWVGMPLNITFQPKSNVSACPCFGQIEDPNQNFGVIPDLEPGTLYLMYISSDVGLSTDPVQYATLPAEPSLTYYNDGEGSVNITIVPPNGYINEYFLTISTGMEVSLYQPEDGLSVVVGSLATDGLYEVNVEARSNGLQSSSFQDNFIRSVVFDVSAPDTFLESDIEIVERSLSDIMFSLNIKTDSTTALLNGTDLWQINAYISKSNTGSAPRYGETSVELTTEQRNAGITTQNTVLEFTNVMATLDLANLQCSLDPNVVYYMCVDFERHVSSDPSFDVVNQNSESLEPLCSIVSVCRGVEIVSGSIVAITSGNPVLEQSDNTIEFSISLTSSLYGASISGDNLWNITADLKDTNGNYFTPTSKVFNPTMYTWLNDSAPLILSGLTVRADLRSYVCPDMVQLCFYVEKGESAMPDFTLSIPSGIFPSCTIISCMKTVNITFVDERRIDFVWDNTSSPNLIVSFTIVPDEGNVNIDLAVNSGSITDLTPGQLYSISIYNNTETNELWSPVSVRTYPERPSTLGFHFGSETSIYISWNINSNIVKSFFRLTYEPSHGTTPSPVDVIDPNLNLEGLIPGTSYTFEVRTVSGEGQYQRISRESLMTSIDTTNVESSEIFVSYCTNETIGITWGEISGESSYLLEIVPESGNNSQLIEYTEDRQYEFAGLTPGQLYNISVRGNITAVGSFVLQRTSPNPVSSLEIVNTTLTSLTVRWTEPEVARGLELIFGAYYLSYTVNSGEPVEIDMIEKTTYDYVIEDLDPDTTVTVIVKTRMGINETLKYSTGVMETGTTDAIANDTIFVRSVGERSIEILWAEVSFALGYNISVFPTSDNTRSVTIFQNVSSSPSALRELTELVPGELYTIEVEIYLENGNSYILQTMTRTYPEGPSTLGFHFGSETSIYISWNINSNIVKSFFRLTYEPSHGTTPSPVDVIDTNLNLEGLIPGTSYTFEVRTVSGEGQYQIISRESLMTSIDTDNVESGEILVEYCTNETIGITWGEISGESSYLLEIVPDSGNNSQLIEYTGDRQYEFTGLTPGQLYNISVRGNITAVGSFVLQRTSPNPVSSLEIVNTTLISLTVRWTEPEVAGGLELIFGAYYLSYTVNSGEPVEIDFIEKSNYYYVIEDLDPDSTVTVIVKTRMGMNETLKYSTGVMETGTTDAIANDTIFVRSVGERSIEILWAEVPFALGYNISVFPTSDNSRSVTIFQNVTSSPSALRELTELVPGELHTIEVEIYLENGDSYILQTMTRTYPEGPSTLGFHVGSETSIYISWNINSNIVKSFFRLTYEPSHGTTPSPVDVIDTNLNLEGLIPGTSYTFEVRTVSGEGQYQRISRESLMTSIDTDDVESGEILVEYCTNETIGITWGEISGESSYLLEIVPDSGDNSQLIEYTGDRQYEFTGLTPGQLYNISVRGNITAVGSFVLQRTSPNPVSSLEIVNTTLTSLTLRWTEPEVAGGLELIFGAYYLSYTVNSGEPVEIDMIEKTTSEYVIEDVDPDTTVTVIVKTRMGINETLKYSTGVMETGTTDAIANDTIFVRSVGERNIEILWAEVPFALGYNISVFPTSDNSRSLTIFQNVTSSPSALKELTELVPGELYTIEVEIYLENGNSYILQTMTRTYPEGPSTLGFHVGSETSIYISWNINSNIVKSFFRLTYEPSHGTTPSPVDVIDTNLNLEGLIPGTSYTFEVRTVSGEGQYQRISRESLMTSIDTDDVESGEILVEYCTNETIGITWGEISGESSYLLKIVPDSGDNSQLIEYTGDRQYEFTGLTPGQLYNISVRGNISAVGSFVLQRTSPNPVSSLEIVNTTLTSLTVRWTEPEVAGGLELIFGAYYLSYTVNSGEAVEIDMIEKTTYDYVIEDVDPDTTVTVIVKTRMGINETLKYSTGVMETGTTDAIANDTIFVRSVGERNIEILWAEVPFALGYNISVFPTSDNSRSLTIFQNVTSSPSALRELTELVPGELYTIEVEIFLENGNVNILQTMTRTYPEGPSTLGFHVGSETSIYISWNINSNIVKSFFRLTYEPSHGTTPSPVDVIDTNLNLEGLIPGTSYTFEVRSVSGEGQYQRISRESLMTSIDTDDVESGEILVEYCTNETIGITWGEISGESSYLLEIVPDSGDNSQLIEYTGDRQYEFTGLTPGQLYNISVRGNITAVGSFVLQRTSPNPVSSLEIVNTTLTSLTVRWTEPEVAGGLELIFGAYYLSYTVNSGEAVEIDMIEKTTYDYVIEDVDPDTTVTVIVKTRMGINETLKYSTGVMETGTTDAIANDTIFVRSVGERNIEFLWAEVPFALGYNISVFPTSDNSRSVTIFQNVTSSPSALRELTELVPGELYTIEVEIYLENRDSYILQTMTRTYPEGPSTLGFHVGSETSIYISWNINSNIVKSFFRLTYEPSHGTTPSPVDVIDTNLNLEGLIPGTSYTFEVRTVSGEGQYQRISRESLMTSIDTDNVESGEILVEYCTNETIGITWGEISGESSYLLEIVPDSGDNSQLIEYTGDRQYEFTGLTPGQLYNISVRGNITAVGSFVLQRTSPNPVSSLEIVNTTLTSLTVRWTEPEVAGGLELIFGAYYLSYTVNSGEAVEIDMIEKTTYDYVIEDVDPDTTVTVIVKTRMGINETLKYSTGVMETGTTDAIANDTIFVRSVGERNIEILWAEVPFALGYNISVFPTSDNSRSLTIFQNVTSSPSALRELTELVPGELYTIEVEIFLENGNVNILQTMTRTYPEGPSTLGFHVGSETSIYISWNINSNIVKSFFRLTYEPSHGTTPSPVDVIDTNLNLEGLIPGTSYTFEVRSVSGEGQYQRISRESLMTSIDTDDVESGEILVEYCTNETIGITWGEISGESSYLLEIVPDSGDNSQLIEYTGDRQYEFTGLTPGQLYNISVRGNITAVGSFVLQRTSPNPVSSLEIVNTTLTSLTVRWTEPEVAGGLELIFGAYYLSYTVNSGEAVEIDMIEKTTYDYVIEDVDPDTTVTVIVKTRMGINETLKYSTGVMETGTTDAIANDTIFVRSVGERNIEFLWAEVPFALGYNISVFPTSDNSRSVTIFQNVTSSPSALRELTELVPGELYTIEVEIYLENRDSYILQTMTRTYPEGPSTLGFHVGSETSIYISWNINSNIVKSFFRLTYEPSHGTTPSPVDVIDTNLNLEGLIPGTSYTFEVRTVSGEGQYQRISRESLMTSIDTDNVESGEILVEYCTNETIGITWGEISGESSYLLEIVPDSGNNSQLIEYTGDRQYEFTGLTPGQLYNISVRGNITAVGSFVLQRTSPNPVSSLEIVNTTLTSLTVRWTEPEVARGLELIFGAYYLSYTVNSGEPVEIDMIEKTTHDYVIEDVDPDTTVTVIVKTRMGINETLKYSTGVMETGTTDAIANDTIFVRSVGERNIEFLWAEVPFALGYNISVFPTSDNSRSVTIFQNVTSSPSALRELTELVPGELYTIEVEIYLENRDSYILQTMTRTYPEGPSTLGFHVGSETSIYISWNINSNIVKSFFRLTYEPSHGTTPSPVDVIDTNLNLEGLIPGTSYTFEVRTVSGEGQYQRISRESLMTSIDTDNVESGEILVEYCTNETIGITWGEISGESSYLLEIVPDSGNNSQLIEYTGDRQYEFTGLTPGQLYNISVRGNITAVGSFVLQRTSPNPVSSLEIVNTTLTSLTVRWTEPEVARGLELIFGAYYLSYTVNSGEPVEIDMIEKTTYDYVIEDVDPDTTVTVIVKTRMGINETLKYSTGVMETGTTGNILILISSAKISPFLTDVPAIYRYSAGVVPVSLPAYTHSHRTIVPEI
ncbi:uncharacterized protein [Antedon mediterranea]|uniref:uncharacterized protein n=1 Tax=Antedon mediterranea TaxID=105859 RepID=UPI003AF8367C